MRKPTKKITISQDEKEKSEAQAQLVLRSFLLRFQPGGSRRNMEYRLKAAARLAGLDHPVAWWNLQRDRLLELHWKAVETWAPLTVSLTMGAIKGMLKEARRARLISAEDLEALLDMPKVERRTVRAKVRLSEAQQSRLIDAATSARDKLIIMLLLTTGARRAEIAALNKNDFEEESDGTGWLNITGKGNKHRRVPMPAWVCEYLKAWNQVAPGGQGAPMFLGQRGRITPSNVHKRVMAVARAAGVQVRTHDFRRTYITMLLASGADVLTVQNLVGHVDPMTTGIYDLRGEEALKNAVSGMWNSEHSKSNDSTRNGKKNQRGK